MNPFARLFGASGDEQGGDAPDTRPRRGRAVRLLLLAVKTVVGVLALTVLLILPWRWITPHQNKRKTAPQPKARPRDPKQGRNQGCQGKACKTQ
jgi:hypothetical protein